MDGRVKDVPMQIRFGSHKADLATIGPQAKPDNASVLRTVPERACQAETVFLRVFT
jgi:hypothetical protein